MTTMSAGTRTRPRTRSGRPARKGLSKGLRTLRTLVIVIVVAIVGALLLRTYVVAPYYVPSASMEPTLHGCPGCNNDHVLVEKLTYRFHDVQAGDIVVFNRPDNWHVPDDVLIKRVIGVAGDEIEIKDGHVYRNGQVLSEPYVNQDCNPATTALPGSTSTKAKTFPRIPNGELFVMGDNRCDSEDSRVFGDVPTDKVIGRAFMIIWPLSRFHSL